MGMDTIICVRRTDLSKLDSFAALALMNRYQGRWYNFENRFKLTDSATNACKITLTELKQHMALTDNINESDRQFIMDTIPEKCDIIFMGDSYIEPKQYVDLRGLIINLIDKGLKIESETK